jgi:hypothetical protein
MSSKLLLKCTGKDGIERVYNCFFEQDDCNEWHFFVRDTEGKLQNPSQLTVKPVCPDTFQVTMMTHNGEKAYSKMGIHDALIPFVAKHLAAKLVSSKGLDLQSGDYQIETAKKVWLRLVEAGKAVFNKDTGRFECFSF